MIHYLAVAAFCTSRDRKGAGPRRRRSNQRLNSNEMEVTSRDRKGAGCGLASCNLASCNLASCGLLANEPCDREGTAVGHRKAHPTRPQHRTPLPYGHGS